MAAWWQSITQFADQVADTITASAIDAEREIAIERQRVITENEKSKVPLSMKLPWESEAGGVRSEISQKLMEDILELSMSDLNFTQEPDEGLVQLANFKFEESIPLVMSMLSMDQNLARMHARISPRMDEEVFWRNYFSRVFFLRYKSRIDDEAPNEHLDGLDGVIFYDTSPVSAVRGHGDQKERGTAQATEAVVTSSFTVQKSETHDSPITETGDDSKVRAAESAALAAEVEAELGELAATSGGSGDLCLGIEDSPDDISDLDLLGEDEDYEDVGDIALDDDAELEAQIAKELAGDI